MRVIRIRRISNISLVSREQERLYGSLYSLLILNAMQNWTPSGRSFFHGNGSCTTPITTR